MTEHTTTASLEAQDFGIAFLKLVLETVRGSGCDSPESQARVMAIVRAGREELEAAVIAEHGEEAGRAIIEEGYRLADDLRGIIRRYWDGDLR